MITTDFIEEFVQPRDRFVVFSIAGERLFSGCRRDLSDADIDLFEATEVDHISSAWSRDGGLAAIYVKDF